MQWFDPRMAGWYRKGSVPKDERVEGGNGSVPECRAGTEKVRCLREKRAERREKREERDKHDQDERVEGRDGSV